MQARLCGGCGPTAYRYGGVLWVDVYSNAISLCHRLTPRTVVPASSTMWCWRSLSAEAERTRRMVGGFPAEGDPAMK